MKLTSLLTVLAALHLAWTAVGDTGTDERPITKVVKLLQSMLKKSRSEGDEERQLFAKYKCYCDDNEANAKHEIQTKKKQIAELESDIEILLSANTLLSKRMAEIDQQLADNRAAVGKADAIRLKENTDFLEYEKDMETSIQAAVEAINVLSEIGADQAMAAADHTVYMSDFSNETSLLKLKASVKAALVAASANVNKAQMVTLESFLQAPFTGTYTAQSGEVVGILKDMRDLFERNLEEARRVEEAAKKAYLAFKAVMAEEEKKLLDERGSVEADLATNDGELSDKRSKLENLVETMAATEVFLGQLTVMCSGKAEDYEKRLLLRTNEEAAITEAIAILNSDAAFETFGTVTATSKGQTLLQLRAVHRHSHQHDKVELVDTNAHRQEAQIFLRKAAGSQKSLVLSKILAFLEAGNPFTVVLDEIAKMIKLLEGEDEADTQQKTWCDTERSTNNANLEKKKLSIATLNSEIATLKDRIDNPVTGLKALIAQDEASLVQNGEDQATVTKERKEGNVLYQEDIGNLVEAATLVSKAIQVLTTYYDEVLEKQGVPTEELTGEEACENHGYGEPQCKAVGCCQFNGVHCHSDIAEDAKCPLSASWKPPESWAPKYKGSSSGGKSAIDMLEFILKNTLDEEKTAHASEDEAQQKYEQEMTDLKNDAKTLLESVAKNKEELALAEQTLMNKQEELETTTAEKLKIEAYLASIKPGCDFIDENIEKRQENRQTEREALEKTADMLKETPAYQEAVAVAHNQTLAVKDCRDICACALDAEDCAKSLHVNCKACMAGVSIPGYCAGHADTPGCESQ